MATFGETLRAFRQASNDPDRFNRRLTQQRLGQLMGDELGDFGFSGAAISDWERGESKINAEDRNVLIALIKVLHRCGGLRTVEDANRLLKAGKFRDLDTNETQKIFIETTSNTDSEKPIPPAKSSRSSIPALLASLFSLPQAEVESLLNNAQEGPPPAWPRVLAGLMRFISDRVSLSIISVLWIAVWLIAWWLIAPSLRWPFPGREAAYSAIVLYVGGTLLIPLFIGLLVNTRNNAYWKQQGVVSSFLLRLYTYQGAGIGFNLGYFFVFPFVLVRYYLGLGPSVWLEATAVTLALVLGNMSARVVPHNLWLAYERLNLADGWIFFIVALLGPLWGIFFLEYYSILLTPVLGSIVILLALAGIVIFGMHQSRRKTY
jgi:transcriptional regulator with XRE-family HTH domain